MKLNCSPCLRALPLLCCLSLFSPPALPELAAQADADKAIKAYCLDFNWAPTHRRGRPFAKPGQWADANPAEHVAWYEAMGANVIQTFAVSTNGYAWYKDGFIPEQPGLKHDFLPEVVKLGHAKGMKVFGYFCAASNPRWAELHPEQSYGSPSTYHIPYTDDYLEYLSKSIYDAVKKTGIDGFMVDWLWMPRRQSTDGKWIESEKALYEQLMGEPFPGEDKLTRAQDLAYSRKAIERCWQAIKKAAKSANPECIIWLTVNKMHHPHVVNSKMYREVDWLMNEAGSVEEIQKARAMVGEHTRLITCLATWNGMDASTVVPQAIEEGVGLYGFTTPLTKSGIVKLAPIFEKQVTELSGDKKNIAMLARAYQGKSEYAQWQDGEFVEPENPPPFRLTFQRRGRGLQDTAHIDYDADRTVITIRTPYGRGTGYLEKTGDAWPEAFVIQLQKRPGQAPKPGETTLFGISDGETGAILPLDESGSAQIGGVDTKAKLERGVHLRFALKDNTETVPLAADRNDERIRITLPGALLQNLSDEISFQWGNK
ncbi:hypothetical protein [Coraliomargarita sinensis]|nr:hypothetical protein [Coraliomargarita sinensis]